MLFTAEPSPAPPCLLWLGAYFPSRPFLTWETLLASLKTLWLVFPRLR